MDVHLCAERVRRGDDDRFMATMASPVGVRERLWPLYALNLEIGRAAWASSQPMICEMRVQWWVDALNDLDETGRPPQHDLGHELVGLHPVARQLVVLAEARRVDCWREPFVDVDALWRHLRDTSGTVFSVAGRLCGADEDEFQPLAEYGACVGMASWLRALPDLAERGWSGLPQTVRDVPELACVASDALVKSQKRLSGAGKGARLAMLPGWMAHEYLRRLSRGLVPETSEFNRRLRLLWGAFRL